MLLQNGAALVAAADIQLVQLLNMSGDLQNQHHTCPLLENLEAVIECIKPPKIKGVVSALEFVKIALQRIFALPFEKIIASYQVHNNRIVMLNVA